MHWPREQLASPEMAFSDTFLYPESQSPHRFEHPGNYILRKRIRAKKKLHQSTRDNKYDIRTTICGLKNVIILQRFVFHTCSEVVSPHIVHLNWVHRQIYEMVRLYFVCHSIIGSKNIDVLKSPTKRALRSHETAAFFFFFE